jgi:hypothetical protein
MKHMELSDKAVEVIEFLDEKINQAEQDEVLVENTKSGSSEPGIPVSELTDFFDTVDEGDESSQEIVSEVQTEITEAASRGSKVAGSEVPAVRVDQVEAVVDGWMNQGQPS